MKAVQLFISFALVCTGLQAQQNAPGKNNLPGPKKLVVVGDSLSAGVQNFSLLDSQQPNGFASIIAKQAGWPLSLPLVPYPGAPSKLEVVSLGPPVNIAPVLETLNCNPFTPFCLRDNPGTQPNNIAVPGLTVGSALTLRPAPPTPTTPAEQLWATIVLGFPSLLNNQAPTEIEMAQALKPQVVIEWLGNNDALVPALTGQISTLTPLNQFQSSYQTVLDKLAQTGAQIITATIPDVTEVAYFASAQSIADQYGLPLEVVTAKLGIGPNDYVRPTAESLVYGILAQNQAGPLPAICPAGLLASIGAPGLPCVLNQADANTIRSTVNCYNKIIAKETKAHQGVVVDVHALVDFIYTSGLPVAHQRLTSDFFGGLFSLDGIHPTNTGYAVIADEFIFVMDTQLGMKIPFADVNAIYASDPLKGYADPHFVPRTLPVETVAPGCPAGS